MDWFPGRLQRRTDRLGAGQRGWRKPTEQSQRLSCGSVSDHLRAASGHPGSLDRSARPQGGRIQRQQALHPGVSVLRPPGIEQRHVPRGQVESFSVRTCRSGGVCENAGHSFSLVPQVGLASRCSVCVCASWYNVCELRNVLDVLLSASWKVDWSYFVLTALGLVCGLCNYNR